MNGHRIYARHSDVATDDRLPIPQIKKTIYEALRIEGVDRPCEVSVLITDDRGIRKINAEFRGIDRATDVLSFPMQEFLQPGWDDPGSAASDPETGLIPLGEIILSAERIRRQAREYGHSAEREMDYLTVHSVLHLLGYDHVSRDEGKKEMRKKEKAIMREMGYQS